MTRPRIWVSACLLGHRVRHNGADKANAWIIEELRRVAELVPLCPEMEMGLGTPREALRLVREEKGGAIRLKTVYSKQDLTEDAFEAERRIFERLDEPDGLILKKGSPSCGLERVKIYNRDGIPGANGAGIFGRALLLRFPRVPKTEEGRLQDPDQREEFSTRVFALARLRQLQARVATIQAFHQAHKLLLMAHDPGRYSELGRIAANSVGRTPKDVLQSYREGFLQILSNPVTLRKRVNVIQHVMGYFKDEMSAGEKAHLLKLTEEYRIGKLPFIAIQTVLEHIVARFGSPYLRGQLFFEPFPRTLAQKSA